VDAHEAIVGMYCFEKDQMGYVDFLEAFVRITFAYPFTPEELIDMHQFELKLGHLLNKLDNRFAENRAAFEKKMVTYDGDN
jgi:hypothetical protein